MAGTINWSSSESPLSTHSNATTNSNNTPLMSPHNQFTFDINPTLNLEKPEANNQPTVSSEPAQDEGADDSKGFYILSTLLVFVFYHIFFSFVFVCLVQIFKFDFFKYDRLQGLFLLYLAWHVYICLCFQYCSNRVCICLFH